MAYQSSMFGLLLGSPSFKFGAGFVAAFLIRLAPFRAPNVEPILAILMPLSQRQGWIASFAFGALSIAVFDIASGAVGIWTLVSAFAYGVVGLGACAFLRSRQPSPGSYVRYAVVGTIAYDALTGLTIGPIFFAQPFWEALVGQIPFTVLHLAGNVGLAALVSPLLALWFSWQPSSHLAALARLSTGRR